MIGNIADLIKYASGRGVVLQVDQAGVLLQKASDYMNSKKWIGELVDQDQEDAWPRILPGNDGVLTDEAGQPLDFGDGTAINIRTGSLPRKVRDAAYRLAIVAQKIDLMPSYAGPAVVEKRIEGAISYKYSEATLQSSPVFEWFDDMVREWLEADSTGFQFPVRRGW